MDQAKQDQTLQSLNKLMRPKLVKKITQLVLSAYVFSFFFSYSSWLSLLLQCFTNFHFYSFPLQLFSHTIDRKCIFLICNGILFFLASNSGLFSSSLPESYYDIDEFPSETQQEVSLEERDQVFAVETNASLENVVVEEEIQDKYIVSGGEEEQTVKWILEDVEEETDNRLLVLTEDGETEEETEQFYNIREEENESLTRALVEEQQQEEDDDDEEENGDHDQSLSTEELNKKFDDFIRRMKEGIRIEAQQQLVLVK